MFHTTLNRRVPGLQYIINGILFTVYCDKLEAFSMELHILSRSTNHDNSVHGLTCRTLSICWSDKSRPSRKSVWFLREATPPPSLEVITGLPLSAELTGPHCILNSTIMSNRNHDPILTNFKLSEIQSKH